MAKTPVLSVDNAAIAIDDTSTVSVTYIGRAAIGTQAGSATWQIKKIDETSGLIITWADGNDLFDNNWDNRLILSYN